MAKTQMTPDEKNNFLNFIAKSSPEELNEYIKKNGKNNSNDALFVYLWDNLKKDNKHIQVIK